MHKPLRALISTASFLGSLPVTLWLTSEMAVQYELFATGAVARAELGDDLGLGVFLFVFALPAALVLSLLVGIACWFAIGRRRHNPSFQQTASGDR